MHSNISKQTFVVLFLILLCVINYYILFTRVTFEGCHSFDHKYNKSITKEQTSNSKDKSVFLDIQNERLDWIKYVCRRKNIDGSSLNKETNVLANSSFWLVKEHIIFCPTFKSASSTWFKFLYNLTSRNDSVKKQRSKKKYARRKMPVELIRNVAKRYSSPEWIMLWDYINSISVSRTSMRKLLTSFMITRHPFERLVSAYRDKLERKNRYYFKLHGRKIVKMFRKSAIQKFGISYFSKENNYGTVLNLSQTERPNSNFPTFWEFVQALIAGIIDDDHWKPMYKFCSVCHNVQLKTINFVLRFENLNNETALFLKHVKWNKVNSSSAKDVTSMKINSNRPSKLSSTELTHLYFSTLSVNDVEKLYKIYEYDFILFNYTFLFDNLIFPKYGHYSTIEK